MVQGTAHYILLQGLEDIDQVLLMNTDLDSSLVVVHRLDDPEMNEDCSLYCSSGSPSRGCGRT